MELASSYLSFRSSRVRTVVEGEPMVLVQDGKAGASEDAPAENDDRRAGREARGQGIASLDELRWAIAEASGTISFIQDG